MKNQESPCARQLVYEMQLRNYSPRTIDTYGKVMSKLENFSGIPLDKITISQFKDYLHRLITTEGISVSLVNQYLSAFKILQVDVLKRDSILQTCKYQGINFYEFLKSGQKSLYEK